MQCHRASKRLFPFHLFFLNFSFFLWVPLYPYVCVSISTTCCLTSKDTVAAALVHIFPGRNPKTQQRFRHIHTETRCSVTLALCSCLPHTRRHMHTGNAQATHSPLCLSPTHTCTKNHSENVECVWVQCNRWSWKSNVSAVTGSFRC